MFRLVGTDELPGIRKLEYHLCLGIVLSYLIAILKEGRLSDIQ